MIAVFTLKDEEKKRRAAEILIANGGEDVMYWGPWMRESFSLGRMPVPADNAIERLKGMLELDFVAEEKCAAEYRRCADDAEKLGLMELKSKLEEMAGDEEGHVRELRRFLKELESQLHSPKTAPRAEPQPSS